MSEKWGWKDQGRYSEELLRKKLAHNGSVIYLLLDQSEKDDPIIGYALVSVVQKPLKNRFWSAANDTRVLEVDNLGLFPNKEGGGRGKAYFEMIFAKHFLDNDPRNAITFAGVLLLVATVCTLFIKSNKTEGVMVG